MWVVFDLIIFGFLCSVGFFVLHVWFHHKRHPQKFGMTILLCALVIGWVTVFYGSFIESHRLVVNRQSIALSQIPTQTIRVTLISDVHVGPYKKSAWVKEVVSRVMEQQPEIIFLAGDFVTASSEDVQWLDPLKDLKAPYGVYAVTGNHEYQVQAAQETIEKLKSLGIRVLENEQKNILIGDKTVVLAGVSDIWFDGDLRKTLAGVESGDTVILLAHNPDVVLDVESQKADLVLAGHTHGGEIRLPWIGPVPPLPTKLGRAYDEGWFLRGESQLFITSGVGESGTRARLFNPPEIVVIEVGI